MNIEQLKEFLYNDATELKIDMVPLDSIVTDMNTLGFPPENYEFETNGWYFWLDYTKNNYPYKVTFSGSLFFGNFKASKEFIA